MPLDFSTTGAAEFSVHIAYSLVRELKPSEQQFDPIDSPRISLEGTVLESVMLEVNLLLSRSEITTSEFASRCYSLRMLAYYLNVLDILRDEGMFAVFVNVVRHLSWRFSDPIQSHPRAITAAQLHESILYSQLRDVLGVRLRPQTTIAQPANSHRLGQQTRPSGQAVRPLGRPARRGLNDHFVDSAFQRDIDTALEQAAENEMEEALRRAPPPAVNDIPFPMRGLPEEVRVREEERTLPPPPRADEPIRENVRHRPDSNIRNGNRRQSDVVDMVVAATQQSRRGNARRPVSVEEVYGPTRRLVNPETSPPPEAPRLNFESGTHWQCADTAGIVRQYLFADMEDSHLYYTIEHVVDNAAEYYRIYRQNNTGTDYARLAASSGTTPHEYWLKTRPAFGGLVQEGFRRGITFPANMVAFLTKNFSTGTPIRVTTPWRTGAVQPEVEAARQHVAQYYTDQAAENSGQRTGRFMS